MHSTLYQSTFCLHFVWFSYDFHLMFCAELACLDKSTESLQWRRKSRFLPAKWMLFLTCLRPAFETPFIMTSHLHGSENGAYPSWHHLKPLAGVILRVLKFWSSNCATYLLSIRNLQNISFGTCKEHWVVLIRVFRNNRYPIYRTAMSAGSILCLRSCAQHSSFVRRING